MSAADGKRPGGLTALAVLNFVFGGLGAIGLLALFALIGAATTITDSQGVTVTSSVSSGALWINLLLSVVVVGLMITSGVGYLGQKDHVVHAVHHLASCSGILIIRISEQYFHTVRTIKLILAL